MYLDRVYFRALEVEDHKTIYKWRQDPVYKKGVMSHHRYTSIETEKKWIESAIEKHEKGEEVRLALIEKGTDELIGMFSLIDIDHFHRNACFQWVIGQAEKRGKGYTIEGAIKFAHYVFNQLGLIRIWGQVLEDNANVLSFMSRRYPNVIQKEGVMRKAWFKDGEFKDLVIIAVLKEDFYQVPFEKYMNLDI